MSQVVIAWGGRSCWKLLIGTTFGVGLSVTPPGQLEKAAYSKLGTVMVRLLVTCIGAAADFTQIAKAIRASSQWARYGCLIVLLASAG